MTDRKWHKGPPSSIGWWPASWGRNPGSIRWWNGSRWSEACSAGMDATIVGERATQPTLNIPIEWQHRPADWPERSRVGERRCGLCKFFINPGLDEAYEIVGDCTAPVPDSITVDHRAVVNREQGVNCPGFEREEVGDAPTL